MFGVRAARILSFPTLTTTGRPTSGSSGPRARLTPPPSAAEPQNRWAVSASLSSLLGLSLLALQAPSEAETMQILTAAAVYVAELDSSVEDNPLRITPDSGRLDARSPDGALPDEKCLRNMRTGGWPTLTSLPSERVDWPARLGGRRVRTSSRAIRRHGGLQLTAPVVHSSGSQAIVGFTIIWRRHLGIRGGFVLLELHDSGWNGQSSCYTWEA
jgi:hypothetical protein